MQAAQRGVQTVEAAEIEQAALMTGFGEEEGRTQVAERGLAIGLNSGEPIERAAQEHDDKALFGEGGGQCEGGAAKRDGGGKAEESGTPGGEVHGGFYRRWNSGLASRSVMASRWDPAWAIWARVAGGRRGPSAKSAVATGSSVLARPATV